MLENYGRRTVRCGCWRAAIAPAIATPLVIASATPPRAGARGAAFAMLPYMLMLTDIYRRYLARDRLDRRRA